MSVIFQILYTTRTIRQETCRAEIMHWVMFLMAALFFILNAWWIGLLMVLYAFVVNITCIIAQRFNRIRLSRIYYRGNKINPVSYLTGALFTLIICALIIGKYTHYFQEVHHVYFSV
ncbi:hypothetical protein ACFLT6_00105 [Chloroflexota bacterium]